MIAKNAALLPELIALSAESRPEAPALSYGKDTLSYEALQRAVVEFANGLLALGLQRGERVAIYLEKRFETVIASFGATQAGCVFVPLNPLLKPEQAMYIMQDCNVRLLVTSSERLIQLLPVLSQCPDLRHVVTLDVTDAAQVQAPTSLSAHTAPLVPLPKPVSTSALAMRHDSSPTSWNE